MAEQFQTSGISGEENMECVCQADAQEDQKTGSAERLMTQDVNCGSQSSLVIEDMDEDSSQALRALCSAAFAGDEEAMEKALLRIESEDQKQKLRGIMGSAGSPLKLALQHGHLSCVRFLLDKLAITPQLRFPEDKGYILALNIAARGGHNDIVELLLDKGAHVNLVDYEGRTPLYTACYHNHVSTVKLLLARGANPKISNFSRDTCLNIAFSKGYREIVQMLQEAGTDLD